LQDEQSVNFFPINFVLYGITNSSANIAVLFEQKDAFIEVENTRTVTFPATAKFSVFPSFLLSSSFQMPSGSSRQTASHKEEIL